MKNPAPRRDKFFLRELHHEIDFYDRKLAHLNEHVEFASSADRADAEGKLQTKRALLEKSARELAASGVEYEEKDLPRSFRAQSENGARKNLTLVKGPRHAGNSPDADELPVPSSIHALAGDIGKEE